MILLLDRLLAVVCTHYCVARVTCLLLLMGVEAFVNY